MFKHFQVFGYRISLYRCPKETVDKIRDITDKEYEETDGEIIDNALKRELIKFDTLFNVLDTGKKEELGLCSRIFNNRLSVEEDGSYYTISREELLRIIEYVRVHNIYEPLMKRTVDYDRHEIGINGEDVFHLREEDKDERFNKAVEKVCKDTRFMAKNWNYGWHTVDGDATSPIKYMNLDLSDNKFWITDAMGWENCIFNFVHILKCFDWENDYLVAIGG